MPCSRVTIAASSSRWACDQLAEGEQDLACAALIELVAPSAAAAAAAERTARSTVAAVANGTRATTCPVADSVTSPKRSVDAVSGAPSIQWCRVAVSTWVLMTPMVSDLPSGSGER